MGLAPAATLTSAAQEEVLAMALVEAGTPDMDSHLQVHTAASGASGALAYLEADYTPHRPMQSHRAD